MGGNLNTHCDAIGKCLIIPFLAQLLVSVNTTDSKAQQAH